MFDKVRQAGELLKMRQQALNLQKQLAGVTESFERDGIKVVVSGDQKIIRIELDGEERKDIVDAINSALKEVQKKAAKKMMDAGGGLSGILKGFGQ
ncbi:MAG: hypothetical protein ACD_52C00323G0008 [uncultured bacterium]|uniref:Nucleoid-associated protein, YbaB/EbfC family n=1 Tax=Candidatus Woesebacteria bacterium RIFCSPHIGHO2_12_FULL_41_24 TaxID=1802510 RepID=A0A1F8AUR5_9BACT|nr:MAG: hypothetical protein ACD_52C00323G0008 [uncultured bacterium]OGM14838.1 MAG: hypothetical protein A2W15_00670 [Candidatus Woesebacteria bacterium RBG_16_41_13]OGM30330.1 MAG: hypothetical protein A2873_05375 [Candidatus Woesebacteria bacterium RIFCSPHIGHO2_01_FULL_42_80]OGM34369.1 MAG: hypothetical protein A3D84_04955 [Candidatus Woesebacteria bacterium RIFCSPHIGHO2_02_FULL_42_20]OGM55503.1 MAG: hypothetical protein A3E44_01110 [Candidatus Woesebacteria bacterium RIFCSPHIGHO2_12_FULL_41